MLLRLLLSYWLLKQEEIAGFFTNVVEEFMGSHSLPILISQLLQIPFCYQYVEIKGEMARALNVFKNRVHGMIKG